MEEIKNYNALGYEDYEYNECVSAWVISNMDALDSRKYYQYDSSKIADVYKWVFAHREIIGGLTLDEQERRMIEDGVISAEDI